MQVARLVIAACALVLAAGSEGRSIPHDIPTPPLQRIRHSLLEAQAATFHEVIAWGLPTSVEVQSITGLQLIFVFSDSNRHTLKGTNAAAQKLFSGRPGTGTRAAARLTLSYTFSAPGYYTFECGVHGSAMTGSVTISKALVPAPPPPRVKGHHKKPPAKHKPPPKHFHHKPKPKPGR